MGSHVHGEGAGHDERNHQMSDLGDSIKKGGGDDEPTGDGLGVSPHL